MSSSEGSSSLRRRVGKRRHVARDDASGSALAAQQAMANIKGVQRARLGSEIEKARQERERTGGGVPDGKRPAQASSVTSRAPLIVGSLSAGCVLLAVGGFLAFGASRYSVTGVMRSENKPLAGVELEFHAASGNFLPPRVTTSPEGAFSISGLPAGVYRVILKPESQAGLDVPRAYTSVESTPLRLKVDRNLHNKTLFALQSRRR